MARDWKIKSLCRCAIVLAALASFATWAAGEEPVQIERYSTVPPLPSGAQADPLSAVITISFPEEVTTVDEALRYLLRRSGYRLPSNDASDPAMSALAKQALPSVHRRLGPVTVERALRTLAGPAWSMTVDPVHRLVSFELASPYAAAGWQNDASSAEQGEDSPQAPAIWALDCNAPENSTWCHPL